MSSFPYTLSDPAASGPTFGLIVLQVDQTIEGDFRRIFRPGHAALHVSRIASGAELTRDSIAAMESTLPAAAGLLPPAAQFDVVGYACTSGATQIGPERVATLVHRHCATRAVTDPLTAALAALTELGAKSVDIVSPYIDSVAEPVRRAFRDAGIAVPATLSFGEEVEARVARIDSGSIREAARAVARDGGADAVFLSCTNLRTLDVIGDLVRDLGRPVISSNLALAWHMARLAGARDIDLRRPFA